MPHSAPNILPYGDSALLLNYAVQGFSREICETIQSQAAQLRASGQWLEVVPAYDSLLCVFDMHNVTLEAAKALLKSQLKAPLTNDVTSRKVIEIPVVYGGDYGPDLETVCKAKNLTREAAIRAHSSQTYLVCMLGFLPGFSFLSQIPEALRYPRRDTPRISVSAGSIGIAGWQTGIYGLDSPGGWQIIGRTPLPLFDKSRANPNHLNAGDTVRFIPSGNEVFA